MVLDFFIYFTYSYSTIHFISILLPLAQFRAYYEPDSIFLVSYFTRLSWYINETFVNSRVVNFEPFKLSFERT